jgi:hypothetical protein
MSVNGVTSQPNNDYDHYKTGQKNDSQQGSKTNEASSGTAAKNDGVVYEPSKDAEMAVKTKKYKPDMATVNKLKSIADHRQAQLLDLVHKMLNGQTSAYGKANDLWKTLSSGDFTVDAATKSQAQADIAEDGYWGVNQTSQRILDFATALTGGDPEKIEEMRDAFKKGYEQAEKTWGGTLPDISQQTYDAVMKGFDQMKTDAGIA